MEYLATTFLFFSLLITNTQALNPSLCSPSNSDDTSDLSIFHIYGGCSPFKARETGPWVNTLLDMASKDRKRVAFLDSLAARKTSAPIASGQQVLNIGNFIVRAKIGTPGQLMFMVMDNSLDTAWVPCLGCQGCTSSGFSPNSSTTYELLNCDSALCRETHGLLSCPTTSPGPGLGACLYNQSYGGDSSFVATLSHDSLSIDKDVIPNYAFGCISAISGNSIPPQGLLGLGRGPLSLISQAQSLYNGTFSYCLPSFKSYYFSGSLKLGLTGQPKYIRTTPLLQNPHRPSLYYVNLISISVGKVKVPIPQEYFAFNPSTGVGTIIDSGTLLTRFVGPAYTAIRDEFRNQVQGPFNPIGVFDTCFPVTHEQVAPTITLHFEGLDLKLPMENTLIHSSAGNMACLAMAANSANSLINIIASWQQQNLRILYDTTNSRLGIARELCN
ncbi:aspartyl protease AED3 [Amaranthus tricolor]|uniref:aspartyl protease AED3 n=1 Tax=Amaranthus tricolor TaxID=29722 RepID=UPI00258F823D|nr:aspartyl protease AED3 [Amaranthus tricolor]